MEKELNVPEINNVFNDEIAAQIKEIESRLEKEDVKPVENKVEEVKPVINTETKETAKPIVNNSIKETVKPEIREPKIMPQVEVKEEAKEVKNEEVKVDETVLEEIKEMEKADELEGKTLADLKKLAKEAGIKGYSTMKKDELIAKLSE